MLHSIQAATNIATRYTAIDAFTKQEVHIAWNTPQKCLRSRSTETQESIIITSVEGVPRWQVIVSSLLEQAPPERRILARSPGRDVSPWLANILNC
jgi:hypothetical protein